MRFVALFLVVGALWDGFTTVHGTLRIIGHQNSQIAGAVVLAVIIAGFLLASAFIWRLDGWAYKFLFAVWIGAVVFDAYTSFIGNHQFVMGGIVQTAGQWGILIGLTVLVSASPILLSVLWSRDWRM